MFPRATIPTAEPYPTPMTRRLAQTQISMLSTATKKSAEAAQKVKNPKT